MHASDSRSISPQLIAWCMFAPIGGGCSLVLPPYLTEDGLQEPAYGWPLIPCFAIAWANVRATVSMVCFFVLGFTLGIAQPRWWLLLAAVAVALPPVLLAVNILYDWTHDATSHNLLKNWFASRKGAPGPKSMNQAFGSRRVCRSFEPGELRREFDGVSNPRQAFDDWIPYSTKCRASSAMFSGTFPQSGHAQRERVNNDFHGFQIATACFIRWTSACNCRASCLRSALPSRK